MNKARLVLAAVCLFAAVGGAAAFKAIDYTYYYKTGSGALSYTTTTVNFECTSNVVACTTKTDPEAAAGVQLYTFISGGYSPVSKQ